tara:strand:+ start:55 stop:231 length:177 start_codon:yes stop_codon:yes gene_type:complete
MVSNEDNYSKSKDKEMLANAIKKYLKKGGKIEKLRTGMTADEYHQREPGTGKVRKRGR